MAKKKVDENTIDPKVLEGDDKKLSSDELLAVETAQYESRLKAKEVELAIKNLDHCKTELTLLSANYTLKSKEKESLTLELNRLNTELEYVKNKQKKKNLEIAKKYELSESKWGYDPLSGRLI